MSVVGEAAHGLAGVDAAIALLPDVIVMDLAMPVIGGTEATQRIKAAAPSVSILVLTAREEADDIEQVMAAGASGYVLKRSAAEDLLRAVRAVVGGGVYLDPAMAASALASLGQLPNGSAAARLSERETEVLKGIAEGHTVKDIAARLAISTRTFETYRARAMDKLGLKTRADIVRHAVRRGWLVGS
jgi:DNA-binding NarL/FixJ family response regulator